ncbi:MAG: hypothetical protein Q4P71_04495 [Actinomycetaceae bacterium]|nr:hypothetical protein [Actinomycetaceae bacterium]
MRRFTDFFVFAAMLIIDFVVVYLLYSPDMSQMNPTSFDIGYALMNLGFIALPGLVLAMCVALVRAIWNIAPRQFYLVLLIASAATSALIWVISLAFGQQATPAQLSLPVFQFAAVAVAMFIGLILGLTGAVPTAAKKTKTITKDEPEVSTPTEPVLRQRGSRSSAETPAIDNSATDGETDTLAVTHSSDDATARSTDDMKPNGNETPYIGHENERDDEKETPFVGHEHHHTSEDEPMLGGSTQIPGQPRRVKGESDPDA